MGADRPLKISERRSLKIPPKSPTAKSFRLASLPSLCTAILHSQDQSIPLLAVAPDRQGRWQTSTFAPCRDFLRSHRRYVGLIYLPPSRQHDASAHRDGVSDKV